MAIVMLKKDDSHKHVPGKLARSGKLWSDLKHEL